MRSGENIRLRIDGRYEARYIKDRDQNGKIIYGYCYGKTYDEALQKRNAIIGVIIEPQTKVIPLAKRMNLLILGAGGQGLVVKEIAQSIGIFHKIAFLDDNLENSHVIGKCEDCTEFLSEYPIAIPSVGNCELRMKWIHMLAKEGFIIPTLVSPTATLSPSAQIDYGTLIEPKVTIGANAQIGVGCIISSGAIVDRDVTLENGTHIDCGVAVKKKSRAV